jgi:hypothetical protein
LAGDYDDSHQGNRKTKRPLSGLVASRDEMMMDDVMLAFSFLFIFPHSSLDSVEATIYYSACETFAFRQCEQHMHA